MTHLAYRKAGRSDLWVWLYDYEGWLAQREWEIGRLAIAKPDLYGTPRQEAAAIDKMIGEQIRLAVSSPVAAAVEVLRVEGGYRDGIWWWGNAVPMTRAAA